MTRLFRSIEGMAICFPVGFGVPFANGPPVWWNETDGSLTVLNRRFDDPRWSGCTRVGLGALGASEDPAFRALHAVDGTGKTWLHLSWIVRGSNSQDPTANFVLVGFQGTGLPGVVLRAVPFRPGADPLPPPSGPNRYLLGSAVQFAPPNSGVSAAAPSWLGSFGRVFSSPGGQFWAVHLRVPIKHAGTEIDEDGINVGPAGATFKFGFRVGVTLNGGGPVGPYTYPRSTLFSMAAPATWDDATVGGTGCGQVISINGSQISSDPPPDHTINFSAAGAAAGVNNLIALPLNSTGATVNQNAIRARFFIANWGSQPDPNQATDLWTEISPTTVATNLNPINIGTTGPITLPWTVDGPMLSQFRAGLRWKHQCMLVELSGGGELNFSPSSASRNMEFVAASTFTRDAQISVRGLPDPGTPQRDVYLLVKTTNMPARVEQPRPEPEPEPTPIRSRRQQAAAADGRDDDGDYDGDGKGGCDIDPHATDLSGFDLIARDHPTYVVYAFHDTGEVDSGSGLPMLEPQVPFGYVVSHDGALHGWEHELTGANLTLVGPDLYRLRVPTDGDAVVTTRIEALERPIPWWERLVRWLLAHLRKVCRCLWRKLRTLLRRH